MKNSFQTKRISQNTNCKLPITLFLVLVLVFSVFPVDIHAAENILWLAENYDWQTDTVFQEGLMVVFSVGKQEGYIYDDTKYGYIDTNGKIVIPMDYESCGGFSEGLAAVSKDGKYGFINQTGKVVIPLIYDYCYEFKDGLAKVRIGGYYGNYGFIDKTGKEIIPPVYKAASDFKDGIAAVTNEDNTIAFIDKEGKLLVQTSFKDYMGDDIQHFNEGMLPVCVYNEELEGSYYGFIDTSGKLVIDAIYSDYGMIMNPYRFEDGVSMVLLADEDGNVKYIDKTGNYVPEPRKTVKGISVVYQDEMYGAVDESGKQVIPFIYPYLSNFANGMAIASKNGKCGAIDKAGKELISFSYDRMSMIHEGTVFVRKDGKVGVIRNVSTGKEVPKTVTATPTSSKVIVNGANITFEAYAIQGNNYFKLRDLAMAVKGTSKQFEVTWDGARNAINLVSKKSYTIAGGELAVSENPSAKTAAASTSKIFVDGSEAVLTAYTIGGNNYFKLRDVLKVFNIGVCWDGTRNTISIDTNTGYTE
jgi:hypothetical protein